MIHICGFLLFTLHVTAAQVIPFSTKNPVAPGAAPGYPVNSGLPVNNVGTSGNFANALASNKAMSERISNGIENLAIAYTGIGGNDPGLELANLASNSLTGLSGNVATFNLGGDGTAFTITSGSPGSPGFGIQVLADALEVGGTVSVNGQIPIYGTVSVNGNVPTDGTAAVNYNCGSPAAPAVTAIL